MFDAQNHAGDSIAGIRPCTSKSAAENSSEVHGECRHVVVIDLADIGGNEAKVNLGRLDVGMTKELLDMPDIGPAAQQMDGDRMTKQVRMKMPSDDALAVDGREDLGGRLRLQPLALQVQQQRPFVRPLHQRAPQAEPVTQGVAQAAKHGNGSFLAALAFPDIDDSVVEIDVIQVQRERFGQAEARRIQQFDPLLSKTGPE